MTKPTVILMSIATALLLLMTVYTVMLNSVASDLQQKLDTVEATWKAKLDEATSQSSEHVNKIKLMEEKLKTLEDANIKNKAACDKEKKTISEELATCNKEKNAALSNDCFKVAEEAWAKAKAEMMKNKKKA